MCHSASYPNLANPCRTDANQSPFPPRIRFPTFSMIIVGLCPWISSISAAIRKISLKSPDLVPSKTPDSLPAILTSWHGNPPVITSTGPTSDPFSFVTSSKHGTLGQCLANTFRAYLSISQNAFVTNPPLISPATVNPPAPENRSSTLSICRIHIGWLIITKHGKKPVLVLLILNSLWQFFPQFIPSL